MRMLAIDCATEACSVALFDGNTLLAHDHRVLGRGHAEHLVPMIAGLPDKGKAQRILVSRGPGSFTGVRIGIATARALAFAWQAENFGYPTLALIAAMALEKEPAQSASGAVDLLVCMNGGHGEWFVQPFAENGQPMADHASLTPEKAAAKYAARKVAGSKAREFTEIKGSGEFVDLLPDARFARLIADDLLSIECAPIYGRQPDAKLPS